MARAFKVKLPRWVVSKKRKVLEALAEEKDASIRRELASGHFKPQDHQHVRRALRA